MNLLSALIDRYQSKPGCTVVRIPFVVRHEVAELPWVNRCALELKMKVAEGIKVNISNP